jgi:phenylpropionate dioxygenase-like ring-hydroxylating dioxygenase large terminal subunit
MLKNFWYALDFSTAVTHRPKLLKALGQELAVYRASNGRPVVLSNLCVHRGGSLADGTVEGDCIRCPYHGWRFAHGGACVEIPAASPSLPIPKKAQVDSYPTEDRYGLVWAFLGDLPAAERPAIPAFPEFGAAGWRMLHGEFTWKAHYARVVENGVDISHTPFVHARSFGNRDEPQIADHVVHATESSISTTVRLKPPLPRGLWKLLRRQRNEVGASVAVYMPNVTRLDLDLGRWKTVLFDCNLPVDETTTRTLWVQARNFFTGAWADRDARRRVRKIFLEDQKTVEGQRPELLPYDLGAELHVRSDAMGVAYRKMRNRFIDQGWGIDSATIRSECTGRRAVVIPSPARRENPELARAWVMPEVPTLPRKNAG